MNSWYKTTLSFEDRGLNLSFDVPFDVFSTLQIDDGTLLLLNNLPISKPSGILEIGCGYGALGLPMAARFPQSRLDLVDRDLLAVEWCLKNANKNHLDNLRIYGSLGYSNVPPQHFDWILCNVPARIGRPFMENLFVEAKRFLSTSGEIRIVVIEDLAPVIEEISRDLGIEIPALASGPKHLVYGATADSLRKSRSLPVKSDLYLRDLVNFEGIEFERPFDISGDAFRLKNAVPLLMDALPRKRPPQSVLVPRCSYGLVPLTLKKRWPEAQILGTERDLLALHFCARNAKRMGIADNEFQLITNIDLLSAKLPKKSMDLILYEVYPAVGTSVLKEEMRLLHELLSPAGQALILSPARFYRESLEVIAKTENLSLTSMISREQYTVGSLR